MGFVTPSTVNPISCLMCRLRVDLQVAKSAHRAYPLDPNRQNTKTEDCTVWEAFHTLAIKRELQKPNIILILRLTNIRNVYTGRVRKCLTSPTPINLRKTTRPTGI